MVLKDAVTGCVHLCPPPRDARQNYAKDGIHINGGVHPTVLGQARFLGLSSRHASLSESPGLRLEYLALRLYMSTILLYCLSARDRAVDVQPFDNL